MNAVRLAVALPGAEAGAVVAAARRAEEWNVDALWVGDPRGLAANADDTYVLVAAAAAASATTDLRLGVFLSARASAPPLRLAEDLAVVDVISGGRLEVAFVRPAAADPGWDADVERILAAPRHWGLADGRAMPVTPAPAQPALPALVVDPAAGLPLVARPLRAAPGRVLLMNPWPEPAEAPSAANILDLRAGCARAGATEAVLVLDAACDLDAAFAVVGTVMAPCLRAAEHEVEILALDATRWLDECGDLHHPPG